MSDQFFGYECECVCVSLRKIEIFEIEKFLFHTFEANFCRDLMSKNGLNFFLIFSI